MSPLRNLFRPAFALLALPLFAGAAIVDDFNDGNDNGWTRFAPLSAAPYNVASSFTFPSGGYRLTSNPSPSPALGGARIGSFRLDETYANFTQTVDIVNWDPTLTEMVIGMVARANTPALGQTNGYISIIDTDGDFFIYAIANEQPTVQVATADLSGINIAKDYRMTFTGTGTTLTATLFNLTDNILVSTISGVDATYSSGVSGVFAFDSTSPAANKAVDATFDNYQASVPEPASVGLLLLGGIGLLGRRQRKSGTVA
jgi:hypothetical protein